MWKKVQIARLVVFGICLLLMIPDDVLAFEVRWPLILLASGVLGAWCLLHGLRGLQSERFPAGAMLFLGAIFVWFAWTQTMSTWEIERKRKDLEDMRVAVSNDDPTALAEVLSRHPEQGSPARLMPLFLEAREAGSVKVVAYLLDHGLDVNGRAEVSGHPPMLHLAVGKAIPRSVKAIMIERVADVDVRRKDGKTALHLAAADGDLEAVSLLLARGANPTLEDNNRNTPLSVAAPDVKLMLQAR